LELLATGIDGGKADPMAAAAVVGLYELNPVYPELESAWRLAPGFKP
jgi:hypothetical protein